MRPTPLFFGKLARDRNGATAIEYGLVAALIAVAAITSLLGLGNATTATYTGIESKYRTAAGQ